MFNYLIIGGMLLIPTIASATCYTATKTNVGEAYWYCTDNSGPSTGPSANKAASPVDVLRIEKDKLEAQSREMQKKWFDFSNERGDLETRLNQYRDALSKLETQVPVKTEEKK